MVAMAHNVVDFWAFEEFKDEKADFAIAAYKEAVKDTKDKVITWYLRLDPNFLNKLLMLEEGEDATNTSMDAPAPIATL